MTKSMPQGTVLSPLFYIIYYFTELIKLNINSGFYSYADNTALLTTGETWDSAIQIAELSL